MKMVKALIELDEETNRILNVAKAKLGFKDKDQTIAFIVKKFQDRDVSPSAVYTNDGDRWMLGEDIPDVDLFFSQVWLSSFVNEFVKTTGKAYKKILAVYNGYHLQFYYGEKDSFEVAENIVSKFLAKPDFAAEVNKKILEWADKLRDYFKNIPERNLSSLSNDQLWDIYEGHDKIHTEYYTWGWIPVAVDMFHNNLTDRLKKMLRENNVSEENVNEYFITLTQPTKKSLIQIEREEFLKLAILITKEKSNISVFKELYRTFQEQDVARFGYQTHTPEYEALLEKRASELINKIDIKILNKIKEHYDKYFYINHMWVGKAYTFEYYLKELMKLVSTHADVSATLSDLEKEFEVSSKRKLELEKKLKLNKNVLTLFHAFGEFMVTKIARRFSQIYAIYRMEFVLAEIANRLGMTLMQVRFMIPEEVKKALLNGVFDKSEIDERTRFCVYYAEKNRDFVFTGAKARELAESARRVENKEISELKGQAARMGIARGIAKLIIRPEDMAKMKQGDILISIATDPDIVPAMKKAAAFVTEQGGVTSHAAIVARELGTPCVIGTKIATKVIHDGDLVEVDANKGIVRILKRKV